MGIDRLHVPGPPQKKIKISRDSRRHDRFRRLPMPTMRDLLRPNHPSIHVTTTQETMNIEEIKEFDWILMKNSHAAFCRFVVSISTWFQYWFYVNRHSSFFCCLMLLAALFCQTFPFQDLDYHIYTPCLRLTCPFSHFSSLTGEQRWTHTSKKKKKTLRDSSRHDRFRRLHMPMMRDLPR